MKQLLAAVVLCLLACSPKYEVVSELYPGVYHMVDIKTGDVVFLRSDSVLLEGVIIRISNKDEHLLNK